MPPTRASSSWRIRDTPLSESIIVGAGIGAALGGMRPMRLGAGKGRTRDDHVDVAAQLYAAVAKARRIGDLAEIVGADVLSADEARYLGLAAAFERTLLAQAQIEDRPIDDTLGRIWQVLSLLPRRDLTMLSEPLLDRYHHPPQAG